MSTAPTRARQRTTSAGTGEQASETGPALFAALHLAALESRIAESVDAATGDPVPGLAARALAEAVGTGGRGGRRWRPLLTLAAARASGADPTVALDAAAAVEVTHAASLVLDDLPCMDDDGTRRGRPATHRSVGSSGAVLVAVACLALAGELLGAYGARSGRLTRRWGRTVGLRGMSGGQSLDLGRRADALRGAERRLYRRKSTALSGFAAFAGGLVGGADREACEALEAYGAQLGWAYQLHDDARDGDGAATAVADAGRDRLLRRATRHLSAGERRLRAADSLDGEGRQLLTEVGRTVLDDRFRPDDIQTDFVIETSHNRGDG